MDLDAALKILMAEHLPDFIYTIRDRTVDDKTFQGNLWDHPRVKAWSDACMSIQEYLKGRT